MATVEVAPPLKPFPAGKLAPKFGGPAQSPRDVLERARIALSPRGSWQKGTTYGKSHEGATRCLIQVMQDVDGAHVAKAKELVLKAAKEITGTAYPTIPRFNDATSTQKYHIIMTLDRAIEMA